VLTGFDKDGEHLALADIRDSIDELRHYRGFMGDFGGLE
jgi:oligoribonuclease